MDDGRDEGDRSFRPIGSLLPRIGVSPRLEDTTPIGSTDKPHSSERTTERRELSRLTGTSVGTPGSFAPWTLPQALAAGDPEAIEEAVLRGLPPRSRSLLKERRPPHPDPYRSYELVGYEFTGRLSPTDVEETKRLLELANRPAPDDAIVRALYKVRLMTSGQSLESDGEAELALEAYAEALADYPGDAVLTALQAWPRRYKWWPAFAELVALIEPLCERRRMLTEAINAQRT